ncbi:MAG: 2'-5' RNA ligase family protein [Candidatus Saccharimonadales bacterium]
MADLAEGEVFKTGLAHITVIPWFVVEDDQQLTKVFHQQFEQTKSFNVHLGSKVMFGPKKDVPAILVTATPEILRIHHLALDLMDKVGARWAVKHPHASKDYVPHIRLREGFKFREGKEIELTSLILVRAARKEDNIRHVMAEVVFK